MLMFLDLRYQHVLLEILDDMITVSIYINIYKYIYFYGKEMFTHVIC